MAQYRHRKKGEIIQSNWFNNAVSEKKTLVNSNEDSWRDVILQFLSAVNFVRPHFDVVRVCRMGRQPR